MRKLDYPFYIGTIKDEENVYYISDLKDFLLSKEEILEIANGLKKFVDKYGNEIEDYNKKLYEEKEKEYQEYLKNTKSKKEKNRKLSKIYIMVCNGKYKVGMSNRIENRLKQLDNRPFPCEIIFKSDDTKYAYEIEQEIHIRLSKKRIKGEWYDMSEDTLKVVESEIKRLITCYNNGAYTPDRLKFIKAKLGGNNES